MKQKKLIFTATLFIVMVNQLAFGAPAKTVYTFVADAVWTTSGHWSEDEATSCGCTPDESKDDIFIKHDATASSDLTFGSGASLTVQNSSSFVISGNVQLNSGADVTVENGSTLTINGNFVLKNGSTLDIQSGGKVVVNGNVTNENNSNDITVDGIFEINGDFTGETGSTITGGGTLTTTGDVTLNGTGAVFGSTTGCSSPCSYGAPLPIQLLSFDVNLTEEKTVELTWITSSEKNNDYFTIERSYNCVSFKEIEEVPGAGDSDKEIEYTVYDNEPLSGMSYYRLKQTDFDGNYEFFRIVGISMEETADGDCVLKIYPNPCLGRCTVAMSECEDTQDGVKVQILDATGHLVTSSVPNVQNNGSFAYSINSDNNFAPGIYIIKANSRLNSHSEKVIIK